MIKQLPSPPKGSGYHVFLDNLFVSTRFVEYARSQGVGVTGTCRDKSGIMKELVGLKNEDKKDVIPWGETHSLPTISGKVCHVGWKDERSF